MKKAKQIIISLLRNNFVKYGVVLAIGIVFVGFLDENSIWAHLNNKKIISALHDEIGYYEGEYKRDQERIRQLQSDPKAMEKIARERYFMKTNDEDIFVLSDDPQPTKEKLPAYETAQ